MKLCEPRNQRGKLIPFRLGIAHTQRVISVVLIAYSTPLAAIIHTGNARHAKENSIECPQVTFIFEYCYDTRNVVIVGKRQKMCVLVYAALTKLPVEGVVNFKQVKVVKAGIQPLLTFVVCTALKHVGIDDALVVSTEDLSKQQEIRFQAVTQRAQLSQKALIKQICHIKTESIYVKLLSP